MKNWNYIVQSNPHEVIQKLKSVFESTGGFVFTVDKDSTSFKIQKKVIYPDQILHRNRIVVQGKISNTSTKNETVVEISFLQDFFMKMTVFSIFIFGGSLIILLLNTSASTTNYLLIGLVLAIGIVLWIALQKKLKKDTQKYKTLISEVLGS